MKKLIILFLLVLPILCFSQEHRSNIKTTIYYDMTENDQLILNHTDHSLHQLIFYTYTDSHMSVDYYNHGFRYLEQFYHEESDIMTGAAYWSNQSKDKIIIVDLKLNTISLVNFTNKITITYVCSD